MQSSEEGKAASLYGGKETQRWKWQMCQLGAKGSVACIDTSFIYPYIYTLASATPGVTPANAPEASVTEAISADLTHQGATLMELPSIRPI